MHPKIVNITGPDNSFWLMTFVELGLWVAFSTSLTFFIISINKIIIIFILTR